MVVVGLVANSCPTLATPWTVACPGSSVHGILQARILEWVAISFSRESSQPRNRIQVSRIAGRFFTDRHKGSPYICYISIYSVDCEICFHKETVKIGLGEKSNLEEQKREKVKKKPFLHGTH